MPNLVSNPTTAVASPIQFSSDEELVKAVLILDIVHSKNHTELSISRTAQDPKIFEIDFSSLTSMPPHSLSNVSVLEIYTRQEMKSTFLVTVEPKAGELFKSVYKN